jgi:hypothetical protein
MWVRELASLVPGPDAGAQAASFAARVPVSYREQTSPQEAALDMADLAALAALPPTDVGAVSAGAAFGGHHRLSVRPAPESDEITFRIRRFGEHGIELTRFLPVLESFGLVVVESVPYRFVPGADGQPAVHIDDVGVRIDSPFGPEALRFVAEIHGPRLVAALEALARGETEVDSLNRLVTVAGLDWRQVTVLRAYLRYWLQGDTPFSAADLTEPLVTFPEVARGLIGYFQGRFDPESDHSAAGPKLTTPEGAERARCVAELDLVPQLQQDQVLRGYLQLIDATLRTNYFQVDAEGRHRPALTLKLDSSAVPGAAGPPSAGRSLCTRSDGRGHSSPSRVDRPRRSALERAAQGLSHRGPRPRLRPSQEERHHCSHRGQGRLRLQSPARHRSPWHRTPRSRGGARCLRDVRARLARHHGQPGVGEGRHSPGSSGAGRPGPLLGRRRGQGDGDLLRSGELHQRGIRLLAGRRLRLGRVARLRPQGHGHHRPGRLGGRPPPLPSAGDRRAERIRSGWSA